MSGSVETEYVLWLQSVLFFVGIMLVPLGLALIFIPGRVLAITGTLNKWISTKPFFARMDQPHYQERLFYRHHILSGLLIVGLSLASLYMLGLYLHPHEVVARLVRLAESDFGRWMVVSVYYLLLVCLALALLAGLIVLLRPSLLKSVEAWGNRWVDTEHSLEQLDEVREIPTTILPGKPRWFGVFVLLGAVYMIARTAGAIF